MYNKIYWHEMGLKNIHKYVFHSFLILSIQIILIINNTSNCIYSESWATEGSSNVAPQRVGGSPECGCALVTSVTQAPQLI